jgi:gamma-glutamyl-gamma-aminobutyrate hydrolase PuuD
MTTKEPLKVFVVGKDREISNLFLNHGYNLELRDIASADIVVFIGGSDIDPGLYMQGVNPFARVHTSFPEDKRDLEAWKQTKTDQLKVGICRGGQFLNVMNGGKLYQHVSNHIGPHIMYDALFNSEIKGATSSHHQQMIPGTTGEVLAYTTGVSTVFMNERQVVKTPEIEVEVVYYQGTRCLCYQGHPEWISQTSSEGIYFKLLLETFTKEAV